MNLTVRERALAGTMDRFMRYVEEQPDGCWLWTGTLTAQGYGNFGFVDGASGRRLVRRAHIFAWDRLNGTPRGELQLDHLCHTNSTCIGGKSCAHRRCVNPAHLELVTPEENKRRAQPNRIAAGVRARQAVCGRGHAMEGENLIVRRSGKRCCRECLRKAKREYAARRHAQRRAA